MRRAFQIQIKTPAGDGAYWKELGWKDAFKLPDLFDAIQDAKVKELVQRDRDVGINTAILTPTTTAYYHRKASDMMFGLRNFPPISQTIPMVAGLGVPNLIRLGQEPSAVGEGLLGYHLAVLRDPSQNEILGFSTLEKTSTPREAEITAFMHPGAHRDAVYAGLVGFMSWAKEKAGYHHFMAHTQAKTENQAGNQRALHAAIYLGFRVEGRRPANAPDGNGHETLILRARNWSPPKKYAGLNP